MSYGERKENIKKILDSDNLYEIIEKYNIKSRMISIPKKYIGKNAIIIIVPEDVKIR